MRRWTRCPKNGRHGLVAQVDRVLASEAEGRWFESSRAHPVRPARGDGTPRGLWFHCGMRTRAAAPSFAVALALLVAGACTANRRTDLDGGPDAPVEGGPSDTVDNDAAGTTCQGIRICIAAGQALDVCVARGAPADQQTFNKLLTCLMAQPMPGCTGMDPACTCPEECYADGLCLDETADCLDTSGATADGVCDQYCGG